MSTRDILPGSFDQPRSSLGHARPPWCWRREPQSGRALRRPARHMARGIERAALCAGRCTGRIYPRCHRALRSFAADERTALGAVHDLQPASLPTSPRLVSQEPGSLLEATTMRGLSGTRWRLWLAFLATLVLASCVEASADTTPPSVPTAVTAWAVGCKQINLAWNASTDTGGSGLGAYNVYVWQSSRSTFLKQLLATTTSGGCYPGRYTTSNTGLTASTTYYYSVAAVDKAGNASAPSVWVSAALPACVTATTVTTSTSTTLVSGDRTAPAMPTGVTASAATCSQINLTWKASTDTRGSGLRGYNVYRNGVYLKQVLTPAISSADGGLAASTVYSYAVRAVDNAGNASAMSATASSNTPGCPVSGGPWAKRFGGTSADVAQGVAVDSSGNIVVAGYFTGAVDFGRGTLTSAGSYDVFVAKYAVDGTPLWTKRLGGTGVDQARAVAVDGSGNVAVVGLFQGTANFGGASLTQGGSWTYDMFVAKYAGSDGHFLWAERFGATPSPGGFVENMPNAVAADGSGNVFVTGDFRGSITFGGAALSRSSGGVGRLGA